MRNHYSLTVRDKYDGLEDETRGGQQWSRLSGALVEAANEVVPIQIRLDNGRISQKNRTNKEEQKKTRRSIGD